MYFLSGTAITIGLGFAVISLGYLLAGFLHQERQTTRLALATLAGIGWLVLGASTVGAYRPLQGPLLWLLGLPALLTWLVPVTRRQFIADLREVSIEGQMAATLIGILLLWTCLLLPFLVYPSLVFFEGTSNHDSFFWCTSAEYLRTHNYLENPASSATQPLFNFVGAVTGRTPAWGRIGAESLLAAMSNGLNLPPIRLYNFFSAFFIFPWILTVLAVLRLFRVQGFNRIILLTVGFGQPVLAFFITNGNLPNLLGTLFSGGLWLTALLVCETRPARVWPLALIALLCVHGLLCSYPEIFPFAMIPVGLLLAARLCRPANPGSRARILWLLVGLGIGLFVNPVTGARAWHGFWASFSSARADTAWANLFSPLVFSEYVPALITLTVPSARSYGVLIGCIASLSILVSLVLVIRAQANKLPLLLSLSGFALLLAYTIITGFNYGWQKTVQFSGIHLAVIFPGLVAGQLQDYWHRPKNWRIWAGVFCLAVTLGTILHGTYAATEENLKWGARKGLTAAQLRLSQTLKTDYPGQPVLVDGATFRMPFFHSMWSTYLLQSAPLSFAAREKQPAGYLRETIRVTPPAAPAPTGLYYVATDWSEAFDFPSVPVAGDRVSVLLHHHNLLADWTGFYPEYGLPDWTEEKFSLTMYPYANGWLELTLRAMGQPRAPCQLRGTVTTDRGVTTFESTLDSRQRFLVRIPLQAGVKNVISARITGAPLPDPENPKKQFPFHVDKIQALMATTSLSASQGLIDFSEQGNSHLYHKTGFAYPTGDSTWTNQAHPLIQFYPEKADGDVLVLLEATPYLVKGVVDLQPMSLRFNGELIFSSPFSEPGQLRAVILREQWNRLPVATFQLHLPKTQSLQTAHGEERSFGLAIRRLYTRPRPVAAP